MSRVRTLLGRLALGAVLVAGFGVVTARPAAVHALDPGAQGSTPVYRYWLPSTQDWESLPAGGDQPTAADMVATGYSQFPTPQFYVDLVGNPDLVAVSRWWQPTTTDWMTVADGEISDADMAAAGYPSLFRDPVSNRIFLYWFRLNGSISEIHVKSGATFDDLAKPSDLGTVIAQSPMTVAAPNVLYVKATGTYYLAVETKENGVWKTRVLTGTSPTGLFSEVPGNPLYLSGSACVFQNAIDGVLHSFYCHQDTPGNQTDDWTLDETTAHLPS